MRLNRGRPLEYEPLANEREVSAGEAAIDSSHPQLGLIALELSRMAGEGYDIHDPEIARHAVREVDRQARRRAILQVAIEGAVARAIPGEYVYYMQMRDTIKIGFSTDPERRKLGLTADKILAAEPGNRALETLRHEQFDHLRIQHLGTERFWPGDDLVQHVQTIHDQHGICWLASA